MTREELRQRLIVDLDARMIGKSYPSIGEIVELAMPIIDQYAKRLAIEERENARNYYAKRKPLFTKIWIADALGVSRPTLDKWIADPEQFTIRAIKKLVELRARENDNSRLTLADIDRKIGELTSEIREKVVKDE